MTSLVKVVACSSEDKEIVVGINAPDSGEVYYLKNGETKEFQVYGDKEITIKERVQEVES